MAYVARSVGDPEKFYEVVIVTTNPWPASEDEYGKRRRQALAIMQEELTYLSNRFEVPAEFAGWGRDVHPCASGPVFSTKAAAIEFGHKVVPGRQSDEVNYCVHDAGHLPISTAQYDIPEESFAADVEAWAAKK